MSFRGELFFFLQVDYRLMRHWLSRVTSRVAKPADSKLWKCKEGSLGHRGVTFIFCLFFTFSGRGSLRYQAPFWCSLGEVIGVPRPSWWQSVYMLINTCEQHRLDLFHLWVNFDIFKIWHTIIVHNWHLGVNQRLILALVSRNHGSGVRVEGWTLRVQISLKSA